MVELDLDDGDLLLLRQIWREAGQRRKSRRGPERYAAQHAPKDGVTIGGTFYPGGEFIPGDASPESAKIDNWSAMSDPEKAMMQALDDHDTLTGDELMMYASDATDDPEAPERLLNELIDAGYIREAKEMGTYAKGPGPIGKHPKIASSVLSLAEYAADMGGMTVAEATTQAQDAGASKGVAGLVIDHLVNLGKVRWEKDGDGNDVLLPVKKKRVVSERQPERYAAQHAPKGGVTIGGVFYLGGTFIPGIMLENASPDELAQLEDGPDNENDMTGFTDESEQENWQQVSEFWKDAVVNDEEDAASHRGGPSYDEEANELLLGVPERTNEERLAARKWLESVTADYDRTGAMRSWCGSNYRYMRKRIAEGKTSELTDLFLDVVKAAPVYRGIAYRGFGTFENDPAYEQKRMDAFRKAGVGGTWTDAGPHSMSRSGRVGARFMDSGCLLMVIRTRTARNIESFNEPEREVIGLPGAKYRIAEILEKPLLKTSQNGPGKRAGMVVVLDEIEEGKQPDRHARQPVRYEARHAPKGGVTISGTFYPGGEFIPADVVAQASSEEKAKLEGTGEKSQDGPKRIPAAEADKNTDVWKAPNTFDTEQVGKLLYYDEDSPHPVNLVAKVYKYAYDPGRTGNISVVYRWALVDHNALYGIPQQYAIGDYYHASFDDAAADARKWIAKFEEESEANRRKHWPDVEYAEGDKVGIGYSEDGKFARVWPSDTQHKTAVHRDWWRGLSGYEQQAMEKWVGDACAPIRAVLRGKLKVSDYGEKYVQEMEGAARDFLQAINKAPRFAGVAYRSVAGNSGMGSVKKHKPSVQAILDAGVGGIYVDAAPSSTSRDPKTALEFGGKDSVLLVFKMRDGRDINGRNSDEAEVVSAPGKRYRIEDIKEGVKVYIEEHESRDAMYPTQYVIHLEEI